MSAPFYAIVIGSGFGGAITACRLAEQGMKVLILERGRRWAAKDYPRRPGDAAVQPPRAGAAQWLARHEFFKNIAVSQAAGVGGGSLAYSSVALEAHPSLFNSGWPEEITYEELTLLRPSCPRDEPADPAGRPADPAFQAGARGGREDRARRSVLEGAAGLVLSDWNYQLPDPFTPQHSKSFTNAQGSSRAPASISGTATSAATSAPDTLDLNYVPLAERRRPGPAAARRQGHRTLERRLLGDLRPDRRRRAAPRHRTATQVFVAASSLGSTSCCCGAATSIALPRISAISASTGARTPTTSRRRLRRDGSRPAVARRASRASISPTAPGGPSFLVEDDGFPNLILNSLRACLATGFGGARAHAAQADREHVSADPDLRNVMVWLGAGMDAGDGQLSLKRRLFLPWLRSRPAMEPATVERRARGHPGHAPQATQATGGRLRAAARRPFGTW
jgi:cholesterol oxidase